MLSDGNSTIMNISNHSNQVGYYIDGKVPKTLAYCVVFLVSAFGNSFIIWAVYSDNRLKTTINFLVANMAVSDLIVTIVCVPFRIVEINYNYRWLITGEFGLFMCKLTLILMNLCAAVSMYSCVFIALDRYYAVAHPLRYYKAYKVSHALPGRRQKPNLKRIIPGIWFIAILIIVPFQGEIRLNVHNNNIYCVFESYSQLSRYVNITLLFGIPVTAVAFFYILIVYKLRRLKLGQQLAFIRRKREQQNQNVLRMSVVIVASLYISWTFYIIIVVLAVEGKLHHMEPKLSSNLVYIANFMTQCYFLNNFFIYLVFHELYRRKFKEMVFSFFGVFYKRKYNENHMEMVTSKQES